MFVSRLSASSTRKQATLRTGRQSAFSSLVQARFVCLLCSAVLRASAFLCSDLHYDTLASVLSVTPIQIVLAAVCEYHIETLVKLNVRISCQLSFCEVPGMYDRVFIATLLYLMLVSYQNVQPSYRYM